MTLKRITAVTGVLLGMGAGIGRMLGMPAAEATWMLLCGIFLLLLGRDE